MTRETRTRTARKQKAPSPAKNGANLGFEAKLWEAADKLRNNVGTIGLGDAENLLAIRGIEGSPAA